MMDDRTLLERAAKAAGLQLDYTIRPDGKAFYHSDRNALALADGGWFAPLTDDGDALRLAVKLKFIVGTYDTYASVCHTMILGGQGDVPDDEVVWVHSTNGDPYAATRRAIVRAAAEIGGE